MLGLIEMDVTYRFVTSYKFNSLKHKMYLLTSLQFGQGRDSFSVFHTASAKASSAEAGLILLPPQDASSHDWQVVTGCLLETQLGLGS